MHAELFFYIHLHASMGSTAAAGWSRQIEDAAVQCDCLRAGQQRNHPYSKAVLAASVISPPAVRGSRVVVISHNFFLI